MSVDVIMTKAAAARTQLGAHALRLEIAPDAVGSGGLQPDLPPAPGG